MQILSEMISSRFLYTAAVASFVVFSFVVVVVVIVVFVLFLFLYFLVCERTWSLRMRIYGFYSAYRQNGDA